ncbi:rubredoxin [Candidatus Woesearchaeota archaeon]|nr:rubredoxin [Candidatus Woesearchaeota archaeon]
MSKYRCTVCNYVYDEEKEGEKWDDLPEDWVCPECGVGKDMFEKLDK